MDGQGQFLGTPVNAGFKRKKGPVKFFEIFQST